MIDTTNFSVNEIPNFLKSKSQKGFIEPRIILSNRNCSKLFGVGDFNSQSYLIYQDLPPTEENESSIANRDIRGEKSIFKVSETISQFEFVKCADLTFNQESIMLGGVKNRICGLALIKLEEAFEV